MFQRRLKIFACAVASLELLLVPAPAALAGSCAFSCADAPAGTANVSAGGEAHSCTTDAECATECVSFCPGHDSAGRPAVHGSGTDRMCAAAGAAPAPHCVTPTTTPTPSAPSTPSTPAAAPTDDGTSYHLFNPLGTTDPFVLLGRIVKTLTGLAGSLALFMFVVGGIMWMTAADSDRVKTSQEILKNATIGLLLIFFSYAASSIFLDAFQRAAAPSSSKKSASKTAGS